MLKFQWKVLAVLSLSTSLLTSSPTMAQADDLSELIPWHTKSTNQAADRQVVEQSNFFWSASAAQVSEVDPWINSLNRTEAETADYSDSATWGNLAAIVSPSQAGKTLGASSKEGAATQSSQKKSPRFNVNSYTGKLGQAEQLFAASKVEPLFANSAIVASNTQHHRELIAAQNPESNMTWLERVYTWSAPSFYHRPLYFQQVNLERYGIGRSPCVQPVHSILHFYGSIVLLPAKMMVTRPTECTYSLGHQRPGDCVHYQRLTAE